MYYLSDWLSFLYHMESIKSNVSVLQFRWLIVIGSEKFGGYVWIFLISFEDYSVLHVLQRKHCTFYNGWFRQWKVYEDCSCPKQMHKLKILDLVTWCFGFVVGSEDLMESKRNVEKLLTVKFYCLNSGKVDGRILFLFSVCVCAFKINNIKWN